jgi:hypothetical protein
LFHWVGFAFAPNPEGLAWLPRSVLETSKQLEIKTNQVRLEVKRTVARFYLTQCTKTGKINQIIKLPFNLPNGHKIYQMDVRYSKMAIKYLYYHFPVQDPPKFIQIVIFVLKIYHLATQVKR